MHDGTLVDAELAQVRQEQGARDKLGASRTSDATRRCDALAEELAQARAAEAVRVAAAKRDAEAAEVAQAALVAQAVQAAARIAELEAALQHERNERARAVAKAVGQALAEERKAHDAQIKADEKDMEGPHLDAA